MLDADEELEALELEEDEELELLELEEAELLELLELELELLELDTLELDELPDEEPPPHAAIIDVSNIHGIHKRFTMITMSLSLSLCCRHWPTSTRDHNHPKELTLSGARISTWLSQHQTIGCASTNVLRLYSSIGVCVRLAARPLDEWRNL